MSVTPDEFHYTHIEATTPEAQAALAEWWAEYVEASKNDPAKEVWQDADGQWCVTDA